MLLNHTEGRTSDFNDRILKRHKLVEDNEQSNPGSTKFRKEEQSVKLQGYNLKQMTSSAKTSGSTCQAELLKRLIQIVKTITFGSTPLTWREKKGKKKKSFFGNLWI